jgi:UPF0755 protein
MFTFTRKNIIVPIKRWIHVSALVLGVFACVAIGSILFFVFQGKQLAQDEMPYETTVAITTDTKTQDAHTQFPVGVNPKHKEIVENPDAAAYFEKNGFTKNSLSSSHTTWFGRMLGKLALMNWYQNLASLTSRILVIQSGERKEQVAENFGKILGWNDSQRQEFLSLIEEKAPTLDDGKFFPGTYTVEKGATPDVVATLISNRFTDEVLLQYGTSVESIVPLSDALTIASLLEREAYDFEDMRQISGVIWNRLFSGMRLQIDATLQYAKGSKTSEVWWPKVRPADKYIASVYNTYKNEGLPPAPISNPSLEAILAALNPTKTECMYYFHDAHAGFHCSKTYEEHVALLKQYYGQGK